MKGRAKIARGAALAFLAALPAGGCRQIAGIENRSPLEVCGGMSFASTDCARCMGTSCCAQAEVCAGAAGCGDFSSCVAACAGGNAACATECRARFPSGYGAEAASLESCEATQCSGPCQLACGGYVYGDAACGACGATGCCDAAAACMANAECAVLAACERACATNDDVCLASCELAHPSGVALERALGACLSGKCAGTCIPPQWACLKSPAPTPPSTGPTISVSYTFVDYDDGHPLEGLTIRMCGAPDPTCGTPLVPPGTTDRQGHLKIGLMTNEFDGYAEVTGAEYGPVLVYYPKLTKDFAANTFPIPTQTRLEMLANGIGQRQQPTLGTVVATAFDCRRSFRGGVTFAIDPSIGSTGFYFGDKVATTGLKATTDVYSSGGFFNVTANTGITATATVVENGLTFPPRPPVYVRPGTGGYTHVVLHAAPP